MRFRSITLLLVALTGAACASANHKPAGASNRGSSAAAGPRRGRSSTRTVRDTVVATSGRDPELERRVARLEMRLLEREAQVEDLQSRLDDARAEVVRAMAKLRTVASRAEAASGMAEAEVALQSLRLAAGPQPPEVAQVASLLRQSSAEFDAQNYGGALYLANQAKAFAALGRGRLTDGARGGGSSGGGGVRAGETAFAVPIRLRTTSRGNVREGPGTAYPVAFAVESGTVLTGLSYSDDWVRVSDDGGRGGWISRPLVARP